jgi:hypothetical protein
MLCRTAHSTPRCTGAHLPATPLPGRVTNLYVLAQSAAGLLLGDVMFKCAAAAALLPPGHVASRAAPNSLAAPPACLPACCCAGRAPVRPSAPPIAPAGRRPFPGAPRARPAAITLPPAPHRPRAGPRRAPSCWRPSSTTATSPTRRPTPRTGAGAALGGPCRSAVRLLRGPGRLPFAGVVPMPAVGPGSRRPALAASCLHSPPPKRRPLLVLGGELDGQMRWPWLAPHLYSSAALAAKAGPRRAGAQHAVGLCCNVYTRTRARARSRPAALCAGVLLSLLALRWPP